LAAASEEDVLAAWSGLGYYRRARMLHQCAKELTQTHGGRFPQSSEDLRSLPGIGRNTAAAIASIAFAEPVAVVDGNVERVLQRLTGANLTTPQIWQLAQAMLSSSRPGDFNQAMMELGATVCVPGEPRCLVCPIRKWCATQGEVSRAVMSCRQKKKDIWCALEYRDGKGCTKIRLIQRPKEASLMAGMWELPQSPEPPEPWPAPTHWRTFRHSITVTNYTVHVSKSVSGTFSQKTPAAGAKWIAVDRIPQLPITGLTRKILKAGGII
jgi:A/G-specific adenine glycosylase